MKLRAAIILAQAALVAILLTSLSTTSHAQDTGRTVNLGSGCNMVTLTFTDGTDAASVAAAVSPTEALDTIWRLDNSTGSFQAFTPTAPAASDLTSIELLDAVFLCVSATADVSMPSVSPDASAATISTSLGAGCNVVGLSFPDATDPSQVADAVSPSDAFESMWRLDNVTGSFEAYLASAPQASDLTSLQFLDAVFLCTTGAASLEMPGVAESTTPEAVGPSGDIEFLMEATVPQVVDLPVPMIALEENFDAPGVGGIQYDYGITYGADIIMAPFESPLLIMFNLGIFDSTSIAQTAMTDIASTSAEELKTELDEVMGGSSGLEVGTVTIQNLEAPASLGEEANWVRIRMQVRPVKSNEMWLPMSVDIITSRRDRVLGRTWLWWTPGPPGRQVIPENLAEIMDANMEEALPELLAAAS